MSAPPRLFDLSLRRLRLRRAAAGFESFLKDRAAVDIVERLAGINRRFPIAVDLGARTGSLRRAMKAGSAKVDWLVESDLTAAMLAEGPRLVADPARPPFADASLNLVVSALDLHWVDDLVGALIQIRRGLKPDGLFIGALIGGSSLTELRQCLTEAEIAVRGGAGPRISPLLDPFDGAALLQRAGFALPVADVETVTVRYSHAFRLLADLRAMGEGSALIDRPPLPLTRAILDKMAALYGERFAEPDGRIPARFDIVTLTGWAPHPDQQQPLAPGSAKMRLADALKTREHPLKEH
jgi:SAM-dependent methyltransferase